MKIIIKTILLLILAVAVFIGVRNFTAEKGFVASLDDWLDQFQEPIETESAEDNDEESEDESEDDDDDDVPSRVEDFQGLPAVRLADDVLERSGIKLASLNSINYQHEKMTVAKVVDNQDLFARRAAYQQATSNLNLATGELRATSRIYEQLRVLHKERANISKRQVEEARSKMNADKTRVTAAKQSMQNIRQQAQLSWGVTLAEFALQKNKKDKETDGGFERLSTLKDVLLLVTFPTGLNTNEQIDRIFVNVQSERVTAEEATYISAALQTNPTSQGQTFYYQVDAKYFRIGMNLHAWLVDPKQTEVQQGVEVPQSSVVWYGGSAWAYIKVADELYSRRPIKTEYETDSGWFVQDAFATGDMIVTKGVQLLLSEELRWQIPDEDDD